MKHAFVVIFAIVLLAGCATSGSEEEGMDALPEAEMTSEPEQVVEIVEPEEAPAEESIPESTPPNSKPMKIDWGALSNPIYEYPQWSTKDACMIERNGVFYLFFSAFFWNDGRIRSHVSGVKTTDFETFSEPLFIWDGREDGWTGMCSPNITYHDGLYYLAYNSWGDDHPNGEPNQLFYAVSPDLERWEKHKPIARDITVDENGDPRRAIDIALEHAGDFWVLVWKANQTPQIATSPSLDGPWEVLGRPTEEWFENAQFVRVDGKWNMMVTARENPGRHHLPYLLQMVSGNGSEPRDWADWSGWRLLDVPREDFNTHSIANAAFLLNRTEVDGYYYLLYAGSTQGRSHAGRGDNRLGLARSKDLETWQAPGK